MRNVKFVGDGLVFPWLTKSLFLCEGGRKEALPTISGVPVPFPFFAIQSDGTWFFPGRWQQYP
jgi:hypothetical protein